MNWAAISIIVSVLLAIGVGLGTLIKGLAKQYFSTLEVRISALEKSQKEYQDKMIDAIRALEKALQKLETGEQRFTTLEGCIINNRRIDDKLEISIKATKEELFMEIENIEERLEKKIDELSRKLEKHLDKD